MDKIEESEIKAKKQQEEWGLEIARLKQARADKEVEVLNKRKAEIKLQKQVDHEAYLRGEQQKRDQIEYEKSDAGRTERARRDAYENRQRDKAMGLTTEERRVKYLDSKARIKEFNNRSNKRVGAKLKRANSFLSDMY